ncbi:MAG: hypothetical protein K5837_01745 [Candidatus Saccharibacteria bacterium]|nr:hypothetical protein [Candidatus Saccharibacteria bacterium]
MYQITSEDENVLFCIDSMDDIESLEEVLSAQTIAVLQKYGVEMAGDLLQFEPIRFADIDDITEAEREKLEAVFFYIFDDSYDNLHG